MGWLLLLSARKGAALDHVNDLVTGIVGFRGSGEGDTLQWVDERVTDLAVTGKDDCRSSATPPTSDEHGSGAPATTLSGAESVPAPGSAAAAAAVVASIPAIPAAEPDSETATRPDFEVIGALTHEAADPTWVDVVGVVANHTETSFRLATFDPSFYDAKGTLICVDTISVSVLKVEQERAFRDAIRCPGYTPGAVSLVELQFAGGLKRPLRRFAQ